MQMSSIPWLATTPESDQAVAAAPFLGSPGPQLDLPEDPQPVNILSRSWTLTSCNSLSPRLTGAGTGSEI